jgi:hypothetical protein
MTFDLSDDFMRLTLGFAIFAVISSMIWIIQELLKGQRSCAWGSIRIVILTYLLIFYGAIASGWLCAPSDLAAVLGRIAIVFLTSALALDTFWERRDHRYLRRVRRDDH